MTGMETLSYEFRGSHRPPAFAPVLVGVVASGNLEVLIEPAGTDACVFHIETSARGFGAIWEAVVRDFHERHALAGTSVSIHDMGATPAVVSLRLEQAASALPGAKP
jgi:malonate decarboxylase delta subunit